MSAVMATRIPNYEAIDTLEQLEGIPIAEIESRARPGAWAQSGFLGHDESFKEVLKKDWKAVAALKTTHVELAQHLTAIWKTVADQRTDNDYSFTYSVKQLPGNTLQPVVLTPQTRRASCTPFIVGVIVLSILLTIGSIVVGALVNPFACFGLVPAAGCALYAAYRLRKHVPAPPKQDPSDTVTLIGRIRSSRGNQAHLFGENEQKAYAQGWNTELYLTNPALNLTMTFTDGGIDYGEYYGFWEGGGTANKYRADPIKTYALLTGRPLAEVEESAQEADA